jgi:hypothetical protein
MTQPDLVAPGWATASGDTAHRRAGHVSGWGLGTAGSEAELVAPLEVSPG